MTKRDLSVLACRFLSVYLVASILVEVPSVLSYLPAMHGQALWPLLLSLVVIPLQLAVGIVLWFLAGVIGKAMAGPESAAEKVTPLGMRDVGIVVAFGVGLYFLANGIPSLINFLTTLYITAKSNGGWSVVWQAESVRREFTDLIEAIVSVGIGAFLVLGCRRMANYFEERGQDAAVAVDSEE